TFFHKFLKISHEEAHKQALTFVMNFPDDTCERLKKIVLRTINKKNP
ncbi:MAG: metal-dependent transcriptional regulator, partial [Ruminococcus sp.]|nr:metal-dependent transcriptional regulator [Ruminococcus sp.]